MGGWRSLRKPYAIYSCFARPCSDKVDGEKITCVHGTMFVALSLMDANQGATLRPVMNDIKMSLDAHDTPRANFPCGKQGFPPRGAPFPRR